MKRLVCWTLVLLGCCACFDASASLADEVRTLQPMDVFQLEYASDPQISPDGKQVAYLRNSMDVMHDRVRSELWIINADGSEHRALVSGGQNISQPRWSPDGKRIAYVSKENDDGDAQIFVRWMDSGQTARLTQLTEGPSDLTWSPDGRWLAFVMLVPAKPKPFIEMPAKPEGAEWADSPREVRRVVYRHDGEGYVKEGYQHVFTLPAEGGTPRQLTSGDYFRQGPLAWSADAKAVYFSANRSDDWEYEPRESNIFRLTIADGSLEQLTDRKGPDEHPVVSPDGRQIAWVGYDDKKLSHQTTRLYVMNARRRRPPRDHRQVRPRRADARLEQRRQRALFPVQRHRHHQGRLRYALGRNFGAGRAPGRRDDRPTLRQRIVLRRRSRAFRLHAFDSRSSGRRCGRNEGRQGDSPT